MLRVRKVPGLNLGTGISYPDRMFVVFLSLSRPIPVWYLKLGHDRSLSHFLYNSLIILLFAANYSELLKRVVK
jgi:hypothetical protein